MRGPSGNWMGLGKEDLRMWMEAEGLRSGTASEPTQEAEKVMCWVQDNRQLAGVMNLAGHFSGVEMIRGARILIREGPALLELKKGPWPLLAEVLAKLFCLPLEGPEQPALWKLYTKKGRDLLLERTAWRGLVKKCGDGEAVSAELGDGRPYVYDQRDVIFTWLQLYLEVLYQRRDGDLRAMRNGQAVVIAGPRDGGKSLLIDYVLAPILGNRMAAAAKFLTGKTQFNKNLFGAELLVLADTPLSTKIEDRNALGDGIRSVVANQWHAWEGKGKDAIDQLNPIWRQITLMNDDANNIRTLPPFSAEGIGDKIHVIHTCSRDMPMPTTSLAEYIAFGEAIQAELPAFLYFLMNEYTPPEWLRGGRFGMHTIQAPDIMREIFEESPSGELFDLVEVARWTPSAAAVCREMDLWDFARWEEGRGEPAGTVKTCKTPDGETEYPLYWEGSGLDLKQLMQREECTVQKEAEALFKHYKPERLLSRLAKEKPERVEYYRRNNRRLWRIMVPPLG